MTDPFAAPLLEVIDPGLLTTIQDAGRREFTHLGVPICGACDPWNLEVANALVGAAPGAPAVEMTLVGPSLAVRTGGWIALAGADLGGRIRESGFRLRPGRTHRVEAGWTLEFGAGSDGRASTTIGAREYLALPGGIDVPIVLGSAATCLAAGFGGLDGRTFRSGDLLRGRAEGPPALDERIWAADTDPAAAADPARAPLRILDGPYPGRLEGDGVGLLVERAWRVAAASDRTGLRLEPADGEAGEASEAGAAGGGRQRATGILSHGVVHGAVQLPPDGRPIVLLADHQTVGGYPVVGVVITADLGRAGQLRPGMVVRFEHTDVETARGALRGLIAMRDAARAALRDAAAWDELWRGAGGLG